MRKSRFTEEQIAMALRQAEAGTTVEEICRKLGVRSGGRERGTAGVHHRGRRPELCSLRRRFRPAVRPPLSNPLAKRMVP